MKTMCPPGYHHNVFVATHALRHMKNSVCRGSLIITIYIYIYIYITSVWDYIHIYISPTLR